MNSQKFLASLFLAIFLMSPTHGWAIGPQLLFSDIVSGPSTGLGDGLGSGAIVTLWGTNLLASQGSSKVTFKDATGTVREAAHVYYWGNADGGAAGGGPADLYALQKMQEIAFSLPAAADGLGQITVTVNGATSNALEFTVRSGKIYYLKNGGSNSADGSWSNPWATVNYYDTPTGAAGKTQVGAGDLIYVRSVTESHPVQIREKSGTAAAPIAIIAYPGEYYKITATGVGEGGLNNYYPYTAAYWVFSKISIRAESNGIGSFKGMRVVGTEITDTTCANGQGGAISGSAAQGNSTDGGIKCLGNYIHDYGGSCTTSLHHVFYLSNRSGAAIQAYELGWNYLANNEARHALHIYDENICGDFTGTFKIHDNVVVNQKGSAFNANAAGTNCITTPMEVYNNLFINCGLNPWQNYPINVTMSGLTSHIKFYNNTIYGYSADNPGGGALYVQAKGSYSWNFGGTYEWINNIVVDTFNRPYIDPAFQAVPTVSSNNIWDNGGDGNPASPPPWDRAPITANPMFVSPTANNFQLRKESPAIDTGSSSVNTVVRRDLAGTARPQGAGYDIGAYEYAGEQGPRIISIEVK